MSLAIPKDSLVLVTGCNGFIGSNTVDHFLEAGYRVRGTTRNVSKVQGLSALWDKKYGKGRFEVVTVTDMAKDGAFDEAVKGVSAIAHIASILTFDPDPEKVIPEVIAGINNVLKAAAKEPNVKRFVYTSSSTAASEPFPGKVFKIDSNTWNDKQVKEAWAPPPIQPERAWAVYGASKTEGERAVWDFVKKEKPHFIANAVLPNCNFGRALDTNLPLSTGSWARALYKGEKQDLAPQWFVDVEDTARLHVAAAIYSDVANERIFAFAEPFNWNDLLRAFRKLRPDHKVIDDYLDDEEDRDLSIVDNARAIELLKRLGRPGFTSLQDSLKNAIEDL